MLFLLLLKPSGLRIMSIDLREKLAPLSGVTLYPLHPKASIIVPMAGHQDCSLLPLGHCPPPSCVALVRLSVRVLFNQRSHQLLTAMWA